MKAYYRERTYSSIHSQPRRWMSVIPVLSPGRFNPAKRSPSTHWMLVWVCPRVAQTILEKRNMYKYLRWRESNHDSAVVHPKAQSIYWLPWQKKWNIVYSLALKLFVLQYYSQRQMTDRNTFCEIKAIGGLFVHFDEGSGKRWYSTAVLVRR